MLQWLSQFLGERGSYHTVRPELTKTVFCQGGGQAEVQSGIRNQWRQAKGQWPTQLRPGRVGL